MEERTGSRRRVAARGFARIPRLSCGHARTQSRHIVQSRFPHLARQVQVQFAAAMGLISAEAVVSPTPDTGVRFPHGHLKG